MERLLCLPPLIMPAPLLFPYIMSGPISPWDTGIVPQLRPPGKPVFFSGRTLSKGLVAFSLWQAKSCRWLTPSGPGRRLGFTLVEGMNTPHRLFVMFCRLLQLYFDFSGIAIWPPVWGYFSISSSRKTSIPLSGFLRAGILKHGHDFFYSAFLHSLPVYSSGRKPERLVRHLREIPFLVFLVRASWHGAN